MKNFIYLIILLTIPINAQIGGSFSRVRINLKLPINTTQAQNAPLEIYTYAPESVNLQAGIYGEDFNTTLSPRPLFLGINHFGGAVFSSSTTVGLCYYGKCTSNNAFLIQLENGTTKFAVRGDGTLFLNNATTPPNDSIISKGWIQVILNGNFYKIKLYQ